MARTNKQRHQTTNTRLHMQILKLKVHLLERKCQQFDAGNRRNKNESDSNEIPNSHE